jgi:hypothetical protein
MTRYGPLDDHWIVLVAIVIALTLVGVLAAVLLHY